MHISQDDQAFIQPLTKKLPSLLIFGPPGVGKGTLSKFLSGSGNLFHLSSGDIFRGLSPASPSGQLSQSYLSKGLLLPDEATIAIWHNYVTGLISTNRYFPEQHFLLLDGIPRTFNQAEMISRYVDVRHVIVLDVKDVSELVKRLQKRAMIEKRLDDADEKVLYTRMEVYEKETRQVLDFYPENLISRFNAQQLPLEVVRDVLVKLSHILASPPLQT